MVTIGTHVFPSHFLSISHQSSPHHRSRSSPDSSDVLFMTLLERSRGRVCDTVFIVCSRGHALGLHRSPPPHSLTDSPRATASPAGSSHGKCPVQGTVLYPLYHICTVPSLCLIHKYLPLCYSCLQRSVQ